jgi:hypothetical protein
MAEGFAPATAEAVLNCYFPSGEGHHRADHAHIQLHTGAPGAAGTSNIAGNSTRKPVTSSFGNVASTSGATSSIVSTVAVSWTGAEVTTSETYTKCTLWTLLSGGSFLMSGSVTASAITAGDLFSISIGQLSASLVAAT